MMPSPSTGMVIALAVVAAVIVLTMAYRWRMRVLRDLQSELMRLVRERTEQLEEANRKLASLSYVDAITGVANRRSFDEELVMESRRSTRGRSHLSLMMADIDGFKAYNDALGHLAGDDCLRQVAAVIAEGVRRAGDTVARYGGEEFAILLPDTDAAGAAILAERIRSAVEQKNIPHPAMLRGCVTISIGVATLAGKESLDPAALVKAADAALYEAKRAGRNRVRVAETTQAQGPTPKAEGLGQA
jgi:diguanylate cyclase (GGDEF)-like protein